MRRKCVKGPRAIEKGEAQRENHNWRKEKCMIFDTFFRHIVLSCCLFVGFFRLFIVYCLS